MLEQKGDRVEFLGSSEPDQFSPLVSGEMGTVRLVDDTGTVHIEWDSGSSLGLIPGIDRWAPVPKQAEEVVQDTFKQKEPLGADSRLTASLGERLRCQLADLKKKSK